jgi:hypothetical protein
MDFNMQNNRVIYFYYDIGNYYTLSSGILIITCFSAYITASMSNEALSGDLRNMEIHFCFFYIFHLYW